MRWFSILRKQKKPMRFIVSRLLRASGLWRLVRIRRNGYALKLHPASLALSLWVDRRDRGGDCRIIRTLLDDGDIYVDVGANIGQLVVEAARAVGPTGLVIAFEAHPRTTEFLRENVSINKLGNVRVAQVAVGAEDGWISFSDGRSDDQNRVSESGVDVPCVRLEPFLKSVGQIRLLKIDVEGFEKHVLIGSGSALNNVDIIYFEAMDENYSQYGYGFSDVHDILSGYGFYIGVLEGGQFIEVARDSSFEVCRNLLATRDPKCVAGKLSRSV